MESFSFEPTAGEIVYAEYTGTDSQADPVRRPCASRIRSLPSALDRPRASRGRQRTFPLKNIEVSR